MANLFKSGAFIAASGKKLSWKVECDALTDQDWDTLAYLIASKYDFLEVEGVPTGGLKLSQALVKYCSHVDWIPATNLFPTPLLIVDDVLTTGGSLERQRAGRQALGVVVFARGPLPSWVRALWTFTG